MRILNLDLNYDFCKPKYAILVIVIVCIINILIYKQDKAIEQSLTRSYLSQYLSAIEQLVTNDMNSIYEDKKPEHLIVIKNYNKENNYLSYDNGTIGRINLKDANVIEVDFINLLELINVLSKGNFFTI